MTEPLSLAKYPYVHDNPVNAIDPSGLFVPTSIADMNTTEANRALLEKIYQNSTPKYWDLLFKVSVRLVVYSIILAATLYALDYLIKAAQQDDENGYGIPVVVWGDDLRQSTTHTIEALKGEAGKGFKGGLAGVGSPVLLRIALQRGRRTGWRSIFNEWYEKEPQCRNKTGKPIGLSCDEYPYNSTIPGGLIAYDLNLVSLKPVSAKEQHK